MKSKSRLVAALRASALIGLVACKPNTPTAEAAKPPAATPTPASAPVAAPAPDAPAAAKTEKAADANAIPANILEELMKKAKPPEAPAAPLPAVVAVVEGLEIKKEELEQAMSTVLASQGIPADQLPATQRAEGYKMLLNELITEKLVEKRSAAFEVKDEEINGRLEQLKSRFPNPEAFDQQLTKAGQTIEKLREDIRTSLRQQNWIEAQLKDSPKATDTDAQDFFTKNPQQFERPEQVRASHILISLAKDATPEVVTEKQKTAESIAARVKAGEAFDKLAAELSEDPSAKQNSGDLNFFSKEQMVPEFSTAAFAMKKGDISDPIRSQFGFHIINVTDKKDAEKMTLEGVKPQLMAFLNRRMHDEQVQTLLKGVRDNAQVEVKLP